MFPRLILLPWDPGFYDILNGTPPPGEKCPFIVNNPVTGLNEWVKDLDSLFCAIESDDYLEREEKREQQEEEELKLLVPGWY